jgi:predicted Rossmann fold flavoprotein
MESFDMVIIGAGPAGLFAAIHAAEPGRRVCVLEKNGSAGAKLLVTGAGKCNCTHAGSREELLVHYGDRTKGRFVKPALFNLTNKDLRRFFEERGLRTVEADDGKVFPETMRSRDVLQVLVDECSNRGVDVGYREAVESVERTPTDFWSRQRNIGSLLDPL